MYDILFLGRKDSKWEKFRSVYPNAILVETLSNWQDLKKIAFTKMFWVVWKDLEFLYNYNLYSYVPKPGQDIYTHVFKNGDFYNGICLMAKDYFPTNKELQHRFFLNKVEVDQTISKSKPYDIIFISYNEPNAETNYKALQRRFPRTKRVHGVKGIHQAHIAAAKLCDTDMFWVVDGDAEIIDEFNFDYLIPYHDFYSKSTVHVWQSRNPINDLEYGNGGVKLLPRELTINLDINSVDMTTSISTQFKAMPEVSNITAFNTDPFNAWKSAFRECVKLSSKIIQGQKDDETEKRLETWTTQGEARRFGDSAIRGARCGSAFGSANRDNPNKLSLINDFDWLQQEFEKDLK